MRWAAPVMRPIGVGSATPSSAARPGLACDGGPGGPMVLAHRTRLVKAVATLALPACKSSKSAGPGRPINRHRPRKYPKDSPPVARLARPFGDHAREGAFSLRERAK